MRILKQTRAASFENAGMKHDRHVVLLTILVQLMQPLVVGRAFLIAEINFSPTTLSICRSYVNSSTYLNSAVFDKTQFTIAHSLSDRLSASKTWAALEMSPGSVSAITMEASI